MTEETKNEINRLVRDLSFEELLLLWRHAPAGHVLFLEPDIMGCIRETMNAKGKAYSNATRVELSKRVDENPNRVFDVLKTFEIFFNPLPVDEVGNTNQNPKKVKKQEIKSEGKEKAIAKKVGEALEKANKAGRISIKNGKPVIEVEPESDQEMFARYFALKQTRSEAGAQMEKIKTELTNRAKEAKKFEGNTATFDCGGKVRISPRQTLVKPKDLDDAFFAHEETQDLIDVVPNEKLILEIMRNEEHVLYDTLIGLGFGVNTSESVTLLP